VSKHYIRMGSLARNRKIAYSALSAHFEVPKKIK
jgi:hypothetical protein